MPLIQRVRYLGIFSNNWMSFSRPCGRSAPFDFCFPGRAAGGKRSPSINSEGGGLVAERVRCHLRNIDGRAPQTKNLSHNERQLDEGQIEFVQRFFRDTVLPELEPILLDESLAIPNLADESLYLAVTIKNREGNLYCYRGAVGTIGPLYRDTQTERSL